ncbi:MAG: ABC transporter permease subunit [Candidatus Nitrohelix vancouverensis]|uniref:ABC transporter permease subunit n=1 Tax=Candidatus Nitrohelix vancouverensis TaxID=2705534 RepID=A0A7T0G3C5_9BACT|nr:MAG: ABC transporter permease subunit [Candidatus Nitrohelix vancouverensis]
MKAAWSIARRDAASFFTSPIFYVATAVFLFLYGFIFFNILSFFSFQSVQVMQMRGPGATLNLNEMVVEPSFHNMAVILLLMIPVITMRSFAEERKNKTLALLLSSPVSLTEIVLGKFLACMGIVAMMILLSSFSTGFLFIVGKPEIGPILTGYCGVLLMSACYVAMGLFASSLTDNQIIAAIISFGLALFMWIIGWAAQAVGSGAGEVLNYLSIVNHMDSMVKGILDTSDLVYFASFIFFGLFMTYRLLESNRWR